MSEDRVLKINVDVLAETYGIPVDRIFQVRVSGDTHTLEIWWGPEERSL